MTKYHTLLAFNVTLNEVEVVFGDYDREVVTFEKEDFKMRQWQQEHAYKTRIVTSADDQASIDKVVKTFMGGW